MTGGYKWPFNCAKQFLDFFLFLLVDEKEGSHNGTELQSCRMNLKAYILLIDLLCSVGPLFEKSFNLMLILRDEKREALSKRQMEQRILVVQRNSSVVVSCV